MKNECANDCENSSEYKNSFAHENEGDESIDSNSDNIYTHYEPSVRLLRIRKTITESCGFHLTRTKWDPYPWVRISD